MTQELVYLGTDKANLFVWATEAGATVRLDTEAESLPSVTAVSEDGKTQKRVFFGEDTAFEKGTWCLTLSPAPNPKEISFTVSAERGAYPFLVTGPGVWHARFIEETLHFPAAKLATVYVAVPPA